MNELSLIIPCFNESENLPLLIKSCREIAAVESNIEFVIVDNGSTDNTSQVLDQLTSNLSFIIRVKVEKNQGYGHGILSGLNKANADLIGWTHADMQTDLADALKALKLFRSSKNPRKLFIKGRRYGRPFSDVFFTIGMSVFETILLRRPMWDINAQPTIFHKDFYLNWSSPPNDFSLDLYAYYLAKNKNLSVLRFPVFFGRRAFGVSKWNIGLRSKYKFIKRTFAYSFNLQKRIK